MVVASSQRRRSLARRRLIFRRRRVAAVLGDRRLRRSLVTGGRPAAEVRAERFVAAWARGDYAAMHAELSRRRAQGPLARGLRRGYRAAAATATATAFAPGKAGKLETAS